MDESLFEASDAEPGGKTFTVLVIYDVSETKRRNKLVRLLKSFGFRVQKSAFEANLPENKYQKLLSSLSVFPSETDSIRVYKIRGKGQVSVFGVDDSEVIEDVIII